MVLYGDKAYHSQQLHAKLFDRVIILIVEPKKNLLLGQQEGFLEHSLSLYTKSPGLWKHSFRFHKKAAVKHMLGK